MPDIRTYVEVTAIFEPDGTMTPLSVVWEDGTVYGIDGVLDVRKAAALRAGSGGDRYTVNIRGKQTFIFFERSLQTGAVCGRWFVERRIYL